MPYRRFVILGLPVLAAGFPAYAQEPIATRFLGNPDAAVQIDDFSSMTCPHCATFALGAFQPLRTRFIETGQVRWVFRDFPLDRLSLFAAKILRSVPASEFYRTRRFLFSEQSNWIRSPETLFGLMEGLGMSEERLMEIDANEALSREILNERAWGERSYGVNATPSFVMTRRGETSHSLRRGRMDEETFARWLEVPPTASR